MDVRSFLQVSVVVLLWAACYPLITIGIAHAPHLSFATLRAVIAAVVLLGIAAWLGCAWPRGLRAWLSILIVGLGATSLGFLGMFHAAEFIAPGLATVIASTQPLLAALLASMVLGERLPRQGRLGLLIGFAGVLVIVAPKLFDPGSGTYLVGIAYVVLASLGVTVSNVIIKRIAGTLDGLMVMGLQILFGAVPLAIIAFATEDPAAIEWEPEFVVALIGLSLFGTAAVYWLWIDLLERVPLSQANAFSFLVPVLGLAMGVAFFGETIDWIQGVGMLIAISGVVLVATGTRPTRDITPAQQARLSGQ